MLTEGLKIRQALCRVPFIFQTNPTFFTSFYFFYISQFFCKVCVLCFHSFPPFVCLSNHWSHPFSQVAFILLPNPSSFTSFYSLFLFHFFCKVYFIFLLFSFFGPFIFLTSPYFITSFCFLFLFLFFCKLCCFLSIYYFPPSVCLSHPFSQVSFTSFSSFFLFQFSCKACYFIFPMFYSFCLSITALI